MMCRILLILICSLAATACNDWRMWETPAVRPHEEPLLIMDEQTVPVSGSEITYRMADGREIPSPVSPGDPAAIAAGAVGYLTYCAQCHGKYFDGNGTVGQSFEPLPGDLRSAKVQSRTPGEIFKIIGYGSANGRHPALATTIAVPERWTITAYIKSQGVR